ncbi:MAG: biopolymer transporter Tol, partial [Rhodobacteraceae bacterium]|nr:biopolymer transporter Tol [Paracoccaceae bacterium]
WVYFNSDRGGHAQIWVMGADGADARPLFSDDRVNWFPHPSPDGRHLIWLSYPPGTLGHPADLAVQIWRGDPDGANRAPLLSFTGGQGSLNVPSWAPDSRGFAFVSYRPDQAA